MSLNSDASSVYWLWVQVRPHWRKVLLSICGVLLVASLEPVLPALMRPLIDDSLIQKDPSAMWQIPLGIMLVFLCKGLAEYISNVSSQTLAHHVVSELRRRVYVHELSLPITYLESQGSGAMLSKITYDTGMIADTISAGWLVILRDSLILVGLFGFLFYTSWSLAIMVMVTAPIVILAIRRTSIRIRRANTNLQELIGRLNLIITESLRGLKELKIFDAIDQRLAKFSTVNEEVRAEQIRIAHSQAANVPLVQIFAALSVSGVIFFASFLSSRDLLSPGEFVSFITAMAMVFEPIRRLTNVNVILQRGMAAAQSLREFLDLPLEVSSKSRVSHRLSGLHSPTHVRGEIEFRRVTFAYPGQSSPILNDFSFHLEPGETLILRGESGSGKSTILNLIAGFYEAESGKIFIDGVPVSDWDIHQLRSQMSLVSQDTILFKGSIRENLCVAKDSSDAELWRALTLAGIDEFVRSQPLGLDAPINELGSSLSGGQRQRVSIARAVLRSSPILLLDEPTSALDSPTAARVIEDLGPLMRDRTCIVSTHLQWTGFPPFREADLSKN